MLDKKWENNMKQIIASVHSTYYLILLGISFLTYYLILLGISFFEFLNLIVIVARVYKLRLAEANSLLVYVDNDVLFSLGIQASACRS